MQETGNKKGVGQSRGRIDPYWMRNTVATLPALRRASGGEGVE